MCDKEFNSLGLLKLHKNAHHSQHDQLYTCNECEFTVKQKNQLFRHSEQAHNTKAHMCERCPYKTRVENNFKIHINREHLEPDNFKCEQCSYSRKPILISTPNQNMKVMSCATSNLKKHQNTKHRQVESKVAIGLPPSTRVSE